MVEDAKFGEYLLEHSSQTRADLASSALSHLHHHREEGSLERSLTEVNICLGRGGETGLSTFTGLVDR